MPDLGMVRILSADADERLTRTDTILVKSYLSSEQVAGDPSVDARGDLHSLGAMGFFAITSRPPFKGHPGYVLAVHPSSPPPELADLRPDVPTDLAAVIDRCLAKETSDRFSSDAELVWALRRCPCAANWSGAGATSRVGEQYREKKSCRPDGVAQSIPSGLTASEGPSCLGFPPTVPQHNSHFRTSGRDRPALQVTPLAWGLSLSCWGMHPGLTALVLHAEERWVGAFPARGCSTSWSRETASRLSFGKSTPDGTRAKAMPRIPVTNRLNVGRWIGV